MNSKRLHLVLLITLVALFGGLVAGTYGINKALTAKANKLTTLKAKDQALSQERVTLNKAKKDIKAYADLDKIARAVVPQDKNQAEAVREIVNIAAAHNVSLAAVNFPASTLGLLPNGATPSAGAAAPKPTNSKAGGLSQLTPVKNISGIYQLPITINSDPNQPVQYEAFIAFLSDLEHNRRTAQVESINIQPNSINRDLVSFSLNLNEYIKP